MAEVAAWSEQGARPSNQDSCVAEVAKTALGELGLVAVCDGVGGLAQGGLASSTVAAGLSRWFEGALPGLVDHMAPGGGLDVDAVQTSWTGLIGSLDDGLATHGRSIGSQMGTTLTVVLASDEAYVVGHVGDCRAYLLGDGEVRQLTEDQTAPVAGDGDGSASRASHALLQAVGAGQDLRPAFSTGRCHPGDLIVICSDGAWRRTGAGGVRQAFSDVGGRDETELKEGCRRLALLALSRGERDNLSVACLAPGAEGRLPEPVTVVLPGRLDEVATTVTGGSR